MLKSCVFRSQLASSRFYPFNEGMAYFYLLVFQIHTATPLHQTSDSGQRRTKLKKKPNPKQSLTVDLPSIIRLTLQILRVIMRLIASHGLLGPLATVDATMGAKDKMITAPSNT